MTYSQKHSDFHGFRCTYAVVTKQSCSDGDTADIGWLDWQGNPVDNARDSHWDLQDLSRLSCYRFEGDGGPLPDWVTCESLIDDLIHPTGAWSFLKQAQQATDDSDEVWSGSIWIHRPDWITDASWKRTLKLLGWSSRY